MQLPLFVVTPDHLIQLARVRFEQMLTDTIHQINGHPDLGDAFRALGSTLHKLGVVLDTLGHLALDLAPAFDPAGPEFRAPAAPAPAPAADNDVTTLTDPASDAAPAEVPPHPSRE